jgi:hypothetical protein
MISVLVIIKVFVAVVLIAAIGFLLFRRARCVRKTSSQFKHNIGLLREEKLLIHADYKTQKKRQQLLRKTKHINDSDQKQLINKSKKLKMPAGEILLAAKIQMCSK